MLGKMKDGESKQLTANGMTFNVTYRSRQSHGDNGKPVRGAYTGGYTVDHPNGQTTSHDHGPHATTETAAKRGANPNAKGWAADQAMQAITHHARMARAHGG